MTVEALSPEQRQGLLAAALAQGCSNPVRLTGSVNVTDARCGTPVHQWSSIDEAAGVVYMPCKTRRAAKCPSCAALYQGDAFRLIVDGLRGGEFVEPSVSKHPALFVTFTAPSFGAVHSQRRTKTGQILSCRPRREGESCKHGADLTCGRRHSDNDSQLGQAIAPCCFDYEGAVLWNAHAGKLWRQTRINVDRALARQLGTTPTAMRKSVCRTQFVKIAEFQSRGLVHFHTVVRIDGPDGSRSTVDTDTLIEAIRSAHVSTDVAGIESERHTWGDQLDIKVIGADIERGKLAGYFAKYATKGSDAKGLLSSRIQREEQIDWLPVSDHHVRLIRAAWNLAKKHDELTTNLWAHQFGFGGHFLTKSRAGDTKDGVSWLGWSTTFKALHGRRHDYNAEVNLQSWQAKAPNAELLVSSQWAFAGLGYRSSNEAQHAERIRAERHSRTQPTATAAA